MPALPVGARDLYFDRVPAALWAVDADDHTVDVNPAVVELLGYPVDQLIGRSPAEFLDPESQATYHAQSILRRAGMADAFTVTFRAVDGTPRTCRVRGAPVHDGERYIGKIALLHPLVADPRWTSDLSHDLRNPLQAILGFADLLLRGVPGPLTGEQRTQIGMMEAAARDALRRLEALDDKGPGRPSSASFLKESP